MNSEEGKFPDLIAFDDPHVIVGGFSFRAKSRRDACIRLRSYLLKQIGKLHDKIIHLTKARRRRSVAVGTGSVVPIEG